MVKLKLFGFLDINECEEFGGSGCDGDEHRCINAIGSYACACAVGFTYDGNNCVGKF